jgi:uncharacterized protein YprB with RNaseH-like and TPR domain
MTLPVSPAAFSPPLRQSLADAAEPAVGVVATFLNNFDANASRIFVKFDRAAFDSNFIERAALRLRYFARLQWLPAR